MNIDVWTITCAILLLLCGCGDAPPVAGRVCDDDLRNCKHVFVDEATGLWAPCTMAHGELEQTACASVGYAGASSAKAALDKPHRPRVAR